PVWPPATESGFPMSTLTTEQTGQPTIPVTRENALRRFSRSETALAWIFLFPGLLILVLFMAYPFGYGIYISMTDAFVGFAEKNFIWFDNYRRLLDDPIFQKTVRNTFIYGVGTVPFKLVLGLLLALVLNQTFRFSRI